MYALDGSAKAVGPEGKKNSSDPFNGGGIGNSNETREAKRQSSANAQNAFDRWAWTIKRSRNEKKMSGHCARGRPLHQSSAAFLNEIERSLTHLWGKFNADRALESAEGPSANVRLLTKVCRSEGAPKKKVQPARGSSWKMMKSPFDSPLLAMNEDRKSTSDLSTRWLLFIGKYWNALRKKIKFIYGEDVENF